MEPNVSIIIPCYNQAEYLSETLDSVLSQTYLNWECVIVNDGSLDNTEDVAKQYSDRDSRFKYLYKSNGGLSSARNAGIKASKGKYILPLDSDDVIAPSYIAKAVEVFVKNENISIVYSKVMLFGKKKGEWILPEYSLDVILGRNIIICSGLYKRIEYDKTKGYRENMKYGYEDWDFWLAIIEQGGQVYRIDECLFFYRIRNRSMVRSFTKKTLEFSRWQIWENHRKLYADNFFNPYESFEYNGIADSAEYRIGKLILAPVRWLLNKPSL